MGSTLSGDAGAVGGNHIQVRINSDPRASGQNPYDLAIILAHEVSHAIDIVRNHYRNFRRNTDAWRNTAVRAHQAELRMMRSLKEYGHAVDPYTEAARRQQYLELWNGDPQAILEYLRQQENLNRYRRQQ
jgi:antirestriction protein ArdC